MKKFYFFIITMLLGVVSANADFYVYGTLGTQSWESRVSDEGRMTDLGNGIYSWRSTEGINGTKYFRIWGGVDESNAREYGWTGGDYKLDEFAETLELQNNTDKAVYFDTTDASQGVTIIFDSNTGKVKWVKNWTIRVKGAFESDEWKFQDMTTTNGVYFEKVIAVTRDNANFGFQKDKGDESYWFNSESGKKLITDAGGDFQCWYQNGENFQIEKKGVYAFKLDYLNNKLSVEYMPVACYVNYENGIINDVITWSSDQLMKKGEGNTWTYSVKSSWDLGFQFGVRVYEGHNDAVWYMAKKVNDNTNERYLGGHTDSEVMVPEGTENATNIHLCGPAHWNLTFDADTKTLTGTRTYTGYDVRLSYQGNGFDFWAEGNPTMAPDANGEIISDEIVNLGDKFRLKVWHGDLGVEDYIHTANITAKETWVDAAHKIDNQDEVGYITVENPAYRNFVKVAYNVATRKVKLIPSENSQVMSYTINYTLPEGVDWAGVTARFMLKREGEIIASVDVPMVKKEAQGSQAPSRSGETTDSYTLITDLGFNPTHASFYETGNPDSMTEPTEFGKVATGVNSIIAGESAAPVYYNLQGIRVENPSNGIYLVVRNGKVTKQYIR